MTTPSSPSEAQHSAEQTYLQTHALAPFTGPGIYNGAQINNLTEYYAAQLHLQDAASSAGDIARYHYQTEYKSAHGYNLPELSNPDLAKQNKEAFLKQVTPATVTVKNGSIGVNPMPITRSTTGDVFTQVTPARYVKNSEGTLEYAPAVYATRGGSLQTASFVVPEQLKHQSVSVPVRQNLGENTLLRGQATSYLFGNQQGDLVDVSAQPNARVAFERLGYNPPKQIGELVIIRQKSLLTLKGEGLLNAWFIPGSGTEEAGKIKVFSQKVTAQNKAEAQLAGLPEPGTYTLVSDTRTYKPREGILTSANKLVGGQIEEAGKNRTMSLSKLSHDIENAGEYTRLKYIQIQKQVPLPTGEPTSLKNRFEKGGAAVVHNLAVFGEFSSSAFSDFGKDIRERPVELVGIAASGYALKTTDEGLVLLRGSKLLEGGGKIATTARGAITTTRVAAGVGLGGAFVVSTGNEIIKTGGNPTALGHVAARTTEDVAAFGLGANPGVLTRLKNPLKDITTTGPTGAVRVRQTASDAFETTNPNLESPVPPRVTIITSYAEEFTGLLKPSNEPIRTTVRQYPSGTVSKVQRAGDLRIVTTEKANAGYFNKLIYEKGKLVDVQTNRPIFTGKNPLIKVRIGENAPEEPLAKLNLNIIKDTTPQEPLARLNIRLPEDTRKPIGKISVKTLPDERANFKLNIKTAKEARPNTILTIKTVKGTQEPLARINLNLKEDTRAPVAKLNLNIVKPSNEPLGILKIGRSPAQQSITLSASQQEAQVQLLPNIIAQASRLNTERYVREEVGGKHLAGIETTTGSRQSLSIAGDTGTKEFGRIVENKGRGGRITRSSTGPTTRSTTPLRIGNTEEVRANEYKKTIGHFTKGPAQVQTGEPTLVLGEGRPKVQRTVAGKTLSRAVASVVKGKTVTEVMLTKEPKSPLITFVKKQPATHEQLLSKEPKPEKLDKALQQDLQQLERLVNGKTGQKVIGKPAQEVLKEEPLNIGKTKAGSKSIERIPSLNEPKTKGFIPLRNTEPKGGTKTTNGFQVRQEPHRSATGSGIGLATPSKGTENPFTKTREELGLDRGVHIRSLSGQREHTTTKPFIKQEPAISQLPIVQVSQNNRQEQRTNQRQELRVATLRYPRLDIVNKYTSERIKETPPLLPPPPRGGKRGSGGGFNVLVRRKGKFEKINTGLLSGEEALKLGKQRVKNTLAASFKVVTPQGQSVSASEALGTLGKEFRTGKRDKTLFVQRASTRLSTTGERQGIQAARKSRLGRLGL